MDQHYLYATVYHCSYSECENELQAREKRYFTSQFQLRLLVKDKNRPASKQNLCKNLVPLLNWPLCFCCSIRVSPF